MVYRVYSSFEQIGQAGHLKETQTILQQQAQQSINALSKPLLFAIQHNRSINPHLYYTNQYIPQPINFITNLL